MILIIVSAATGGGDDSDDQEAAATTPPTTTSTVPAGIIVTDVIDGDTVQLSDGTTVRAIGIDAPETVAPNSPTGCFGPEASEWTERTLLHQTVTLTTDPTQDLQDSFGRALRYIQLPDGSDFSVLAAAGGYAHSYVYNTEPTKIGEIRAAEEAAKASSLGVWSTACTAPPPPPPAPEPPPPVVAPAPLVAAPPAAEPASDCEPGYDPCVPSYPPDLDCGDLNGPYRVTGSDPHNLDADGDGRGCDAG